MPTALPKQGLPPKPKRQEAMVPPGTAKAVADALERVHAQQAISQSADSIRHRNHALQAFLGDREPVGHYRFQEKQAGSARPNGYSPAGGGFIAMERSEFDQMHRDHALAKTILGDTLPKWAPLLPSLDDAREFYGGLDRRDHLTIEATQMFETAFKLALMGEAGKDALRAGLLEIESPEVESPQIEESDEVEEFEVVVNRPVVDEDAPKSKVSPPEEDQLSLGQILAKVEADNAQDEENI